jgi:L-threonylcarbamoyladenylate synthase
MSHHDSSLDDGPARIVDASPAGVARAVDALHEGLVIGLPTETVYGLAADFENDDAIREVFRVKGRPVDHPLIVHIAELEQLDQIAAEVDDACRALVQHCWPGPLTVIVRASSSVSRVATGGHDTVAVRMPAHPVARSIISALGHPVVAPSANRFGRVSPTTARHVVDDLGSDVSIVVDGGACDIGVESTIVDCTTEHLNILRPGSITVEDLRRILEHAAVSDVVADTADAGGTDGTGGTGGTASAESAVRAPGMLARHYAPRAKLVLHEHRRTLPNPPAIVLDYSGDPVAAAHSLYDDLRRCDADGATEVHVLMPSPAGLGYALRDRLHKAAAGSGSETENSSDF